MEGAATRTSVTDEGSFTWSSGDKIWLETTKGSVIGTLSDGGGTPNGNFTYGTYIGELTGNSVYPYNSEHSISGDVLSVVLPASYDLGTVLENTNAAMYGKNVEGTLKFTHLAGVMRFIFKNVPVGVDRFTVTLDKKINGTFTADLTKEFPVLESSATDVESEKTVTLNFDALETPSDIKFYVPLPLGEYASLALELFKGEESVWDYSNTVTNTVNRKSLILMPSVSMGGSIGGDIEGGESEGGEAPVGPAEGDYVDEYGINHGQGVEMADGTVWAPVNCRYHAELHQCGKFYQYGRKYGVGLPDGWRVATHGEWQNLEFNYRGDDTDVHGHSCRYFVHANIAIEHPNSPKILIPQVRSPYLFGQNIGRYWCAESASKSGVCAQPVDNGQGFSNALLVRCVRVK